MTPKFAVGEVVILQSKDMPEFNGEHTVRVVLSKVGRYFDRVEGADINHRRDAVDFAYIMEDIIVAENMLEDARGGRHPGEVVWKESALRKKHLPGEMNFNSLVSSLKTPVKTPEEVPYGVC